jgi:hypothetical protein
MGRGWNASLPPSESPTATPCLSTSVQPRPTSSNLVQPGGAVPWSMVPERSVKLS